MKKNRNSHFLYIENDTLQIKKQKENVCGDQFLINRTNLYTTYILCDGMGSGVKASIAATMCASRINHLIDSQVPLPKIVKKISLLMSRAKNENIPYSTFTIVKILPSGQFNIYNYENPFPLLINKDNCLSFDASYEIIGKEVVGHVTGRLYKGDSLLVMSDGVSQAGLGRVPGFGWGVDNIRDYLDHLLQKEISSKELLNLISDAVKRLSGGSFHDDITITKLTARNSKVLNLITGPPKNKKDDANYVKSFMDTKGMKVVCGSTTADLVAKQIGKQIEVIENTPTFANPPQYKIEGIDFVTEGAVTLNQIYNVLDSDLDESFEKNCVIEIANKLKEADHINIFWGLSKNSAHKDATFLQMGILDRETIVPLLIKKLRGMNKTLNIKRY
jgi:hypothetical protein